ncbi:MAG: TauD/TfdA dioxygenase family protein [Hyphomicrobiaceae bacterium]
MSMPSPDSPAYAPAVPFGIRRLAPRIGAEISGLDLSQPLAADTLSRLRAAWLEHHILLFRDQSLTEAQQARFATYFGEPVGARSAQRQGPDADARVMLISNVRENGKLIGQLPDGELQFHADSVFLERPLMGAILYAVELPSTGGNTIFTNVEAAYDALTDAEKERFGELKALNAFDYATQVRTGRFDPASGPHFVHPVIRTHPETGRKAIFVNRLMTQEIVGLDADESDSLLARLWEECERPAYAYEHVWKLGDVLIWDNRSTQHARTDFPAGERRLLRRVGIEGDVPF